MCNQLDVSDAEVIMDIVQHIRESEEMNQDPDAQFITGKLLSMAHERVPMNCKGCEGVYAICSSKPRCSYILRGEGMDNLINKESGEPLMSCPYRKIREVLGESI